jgi:hypothetical protein
MRISACFFYPQDRVTILAMRALRTLVAVAVLIGAVGACSTSRIYKDSWRPEERGGAMQPRLLAAALFVKDSADIDVINRAGATLIGWHDARDSWAMRAASTGGTHFAPIQEPPPADRSGCYLWGDIPMCSSGRKARYWSRIAVFRLSPDRWHALPVHLIPTDGDVMAGSASAVRAGCRNVNPHYGMVRCDKGWHVVTNPAVAANIPPVVPVSEGPVVSGPRGAAVGQPDESPDEVEP